MSYILKTLEFDILQFFFLADIDEAYTMVFNVLETKEQ